MASGDQLSPPGSSTYSSEIFHAGDGTWDSTRDSYLLPNVMGLPFDLMRYNGMGNRFAGLPEYHHIVTGHGVLAAITFLFIVPTAILAAGFYHRDPRAALRLHIALQTLTVILTTIIFVLGYFAVGPTRSLTNPHHAIGLAIYLLILVQAIGGWIIKKIEKGKVRYHLPMKLMLHQWMGRAIALLALAQIPIGLTLYGSPAFLFVLYTLVVAAWIVAYFILSYQAKKRSALQFDEGSYVSGATGVTGTTASHHPDRHKLEAAAGALGLGAAIAAIRRRTSGNHRREDSQSGMLRPEGSEYDDKYTESRFSEPDDHHQEGKNHTWRNRLLGTAAGIGGIAAIRSFMNRGKDDEKRRRHSESDLSYNRPPLGGSVATSDGGRLEEGYPSTPGHGSDWNRVERMEAAQAHAGHGRPGMPPSEGSYFTQYTEEERQGFSKYLPGALGGLVAAGGIGKFLERRKSKKEERRMEEQRRQDQRYGPPQPLPGQSPYADTPPRRQRRHSYSPTTNETTENTNYNRFGGAPPPVMGGALPTGQQRQTSHGSVMAEPHPPPSNIPPPPQTTMMGPPPPGHASDGFNSSSDVYNNSPSAGRRSRHHSDRGTSVINEPLGGGQSMGNMSGALSPPPPVHADYGARPSSGSPNRGNVASPPVSVNVKFSNDGRHVTLRRLSEEEAARKRAQQQQPQSLQPPDRPYARTSPSNSQGASPGPSRLTPQASYQAGPQSTLSPPPGSAGQGSGSPAGQGAGSVVSSQAYDENRRRRRAERARAEQARQQQKRNSRNGGGSNRVEFT